MNTQTSIKVLNWNVAGAKYFDLPTDQKKDEFRNDANNDLIELVRRYSPDIITLQETVAYCQPGDQRNYLVDAPAGYAIANSILIDSDRHPYVAKWKKMMKKGNWAEGTYFGQGLSILWKCRNSQLKHFPVWRIPGMSIQPDELNHVEDVILMSGLYFGDRNTEPRAALVAHFVLTQDPRNPSVAFEKPLDVFVVNLHLTTLKNEREGIPEIDKCASQTRLHQLDIILHGIVSRYNRWRSDDYMTSGEKPATANGEDPNRFSPVWILCGDFNFTPESEEFQRIQRANFVDVCPQKGKGTKASGFGAQPRLTVDYIFAGPKFVSLDPVIVADQTLGNPTPQTWARVSDHYPIYAEVPLTPT